MDNHSFALWVLFLFVLVIFLLLVFFIVLIDDLITFIKVNLSPKLLVRIKHVGLERFFVFELQGFGEAIDELTALVHSYFWIISLGIQLDVILKLSGKVFWVEGEWCVSTNVYWDVIQFVEL